MAGLDVVFRLTDGKGFDQTYPYDLVGPRPGDAPADSAAPAGGAR
ncbi:MAG: hypothetical protein R2882_08795 [Gemmatimonadales bacterium]